MVHTTQTAYLRKWMDAKMSASALSVNDVSLVLQFLTRVPAINLYNGGKMVAYVSCVPFTCL